MHIPDGFVSGPVNLAAAAISGAALGASLRRTARGLGEDTRRMPLLAMGAAFVFAAQMLNFPVAAGTSGHFLGAVTLAALLGPWESCLAIALVLVVQAFLFADGGLSALGSNALNMGVVGGLGGYGLLRLLRAVLPAGRGWFLAAVAVASWASIVAASSACALELAASGTVPLVVALPAMAGVHAVIGLGEAMVAVAVVGAVTAARPDILPAWARLEVRPAWAGRPRGVVVLAAAGVAVSCLLAAFVSPLASARPDGLEKVAEDAGFMDRAVEGARALWHLAPFPDYALAAAGGGGLSTGAAGLVGTVVVFGAGYLLLRLLARRRTT